MERGRWKGEWLSAGWRLVVFVAAGMSGCAAVERGAVEVAEVEIRGRVFRVEVAADAAAQARGLGGRGEVAADGGMLFVFERAEWQSFVMSDCQIPIDLVYLDGAGRVISTHAMKPEAPRGVGEGEIEYVSRLKSYASDGAAAFAVELRGGMVAELGVVRGDVARSRRFPR